MLLEVNSVSWWAWESCRYHFIIIEIIILLFWF